MKQAWLNESSGGSKNFEKRGGGRKTIYQPCPHLSQMRTTKYMPFTRKKRLFEKKYEPVGGGRPHRPPPFESTTEPECMCAWTSEDDASLLRFNGYMAEAGWCCY